MNSCLKTPLLVLAGCIISLAAHAQTTRQLIKPSDATSGTATAGPSMVIPVIPSNICTSTNNNCVTQAGLNGGSVVIPNQSVLPGTLCGAATKSTTSPDGRTQYYWYGSDCNNVAILGEPSVYIYMGEDTSPYKVYAGTNCPTGYTFRNTGTFFSCMKD